MILRTNVLRAFCRNIMRIRTRFLINFPSNYLLTRLPWYHSFLVGRYMDQRVLRLRASNNFCIHFPFKGGLYKGPMSRICASIFGPFILTFLCHPSNLFSPVATTGRTRFFFIRYLCTRTRSISKRYTRELCFPINRIVKVNFRNSFDL